MTRCINTCPLSDLTFENDEDAAIGHVAAGHIADGASLVRIVSCPSHKCPAAAPAPEPAAGGDEVCPFCKMTVVEVVADGAHASGCKLTGAKPLATPAAGGEEWPGFEKISNLLHSLTYSTPTIDGWKLEDLAPGLRGKPVGNGLQAIIDWLSSLPPRPGASVDAGLRHKIAILLAEIAQFDVPEKTMLARWVNELRELLK